MVVVADDLIWASRLVEQVRSAGAEAVRARRLDDLRAALAGSSPTGALAPDSVPLDAVPLDRLPTDAPAPPAVPRGPAPPGVPAAAIVDLGARAYDAIEACRLAAGAGLPVLAIGQHDDRELRRRALDAGVERVLAYRKMAADGASVIVHWLAIDRSPGSMRDAHPQEEAEP